MHAICASTTSRELNSPSAIPRAKRQADISINMIHSLSQTPHRGRSAYPVAFFLHAHDFSIDAQPGVSRSRTADLPARLHHGSNGDASRTVTLVDDALPGPLVLQLVIPWEEARYTHGAPGAVFVHGGWTSDIIPLGDDQANLVGATGAWSIYVNLPGGGGTMSSGGENDRRGSDSRQAIGAALRYSAGMLEDNSGCRIDDRMPTGIAEERVLAAFSNGGNLAWATLADPDVALPDIHGIVVFETPASSQMALGEPGTGNRTSPLHTEGSCHIDEDSALVCDYDYQNLAFDMNTDPDTAGTLFLDVDQDGFYSDKMDFPLGLAKAEDNENWAHSLQAMEAVESAKLITQARLNSQDTAEFWQWREAPRQSPQRSNDFPTSGNVDCTELITSWRAPPITHMSLGWWKHAAFQHALDSVAPRSKLCGIIGSASSITSISMPILKSESVIQTCLWNRKTTPECVGATISPQAY